MRRSTRQTTLREGWTVHKLTEWDCHPRTIDLIPTIAWVVEGPVDVEHLTASFDAAICRRAPWVGGRFAKTGISTCPYELHVPPSTDTATARFVRTIDNRPAQSLSSLLQYTRCGHGEPSLKPLKSGLLNPSRTTLNAVAHYIKADRPPIHLHFLPAKDVTLISIAWSHVIMDAVSLGQLVAAWEEEIREDDPEPKDTAPAVQSGNYWEFATEVDQEKGDSSLPYGFIEPTLGDVARIGWRILLDLVRHPTSRKTLYIPRSVAEAWMDEAKSLLNDGEWVSRNDLTTAWIYKHAHSTFPNEHLDTLCYVVNLRDRHPSLARSLIGNTWLSHVLRPSTSLTLRTSSLASVALSLRKSLEPLTSSSWISSRASTEIRTLKSGKTLLPIGRSKNRFCVVSSWAKCGFTKPHFGEGTKTVASVPHTWFPVYPGFWTVIDDGDGGWLLSGKLTNKAWTAMRGQLEKEMECLKG